MKRLWPLFLASLVLAVGCSREPDAPQVASDGHVHAPGESHDHSHEGEGNTLSNEGDMNPEQAMSEDEMAAKADVPLYPESDAPDGRSNVRTDGVQKRYELVMTTSDSPEKVLEFYKKSLTKSQMMGGKLMGASKNGNSVMVTADKGEDLTTITIVSIAMAKS